MKFTQKYISITAAVIGLTLLSSCAERYLAEIPYPNDVTFNELVLDRFTFDIPDDSFTVPASKSGEITVNVSKNTDGSYSGFALSNKNFRSYPWDLSPTFEPTGGLTDTEIQDAINTTAFSVYTSLDVNRTENYLVGNTNDDNAFFTLPTPTVVEHVLVANTTYNALLRTYGSIYSNDLDTDTQMYDINGDPVSNPNIDNPDQDMRGVFTLPGVDGTLNTLRLEGVEQLEKDEVAIATSEAIGGEAAGIAAGNAAVEQYKIDYPSRANSSYWLGRAYDAGYAAGYTDVIQAAVDAYSNGHVTLHIEGFLEGTSVGTIDVYLSLLEGVDLENPEFVFTVNDWRRVDLTSFGEVDKVLFNMSSSYVNTDGTMVYPPTFCLDGIRLQ